MLGRIYLSQGLPQVAFVQAALAQALALLVQSLLLDWN